MNQNKVTPINLKYFEVFIDLVETKNFQSTATLHGMTKAAVSQQLRAMERHFGALLIDRSQNRFQLSPKGIRVYRGAKEVISQYKLTLSDLQEMEGIISGTIRISAIPSVGLHVLPRYIETFRQNYPDVDIKIEYRRSDAVYENILNNSVEFGLLSFPEMQPQFETLPFMNDHFVLISHPDHPLATAGKVSLPSLVHYDLIGIEHGGSSHSSIEKIIRENGIVPIMIFDNIETIKQSVEINAGVAIVPYSTIRREIELGSLVALEFQEQKFIRPLAVLYRKGRVLMPAMKKFIETLQENPTLKHGS